MTSLTDRAQGKEGPQAPGGGAGSGASCLGPSPLTLPPFPGPCPSWLLILPREGLVPPRRTGPPDPGFSVIF